MNSPWLVLLFQPRLGLGRLPDHQQSSFTANGVQYVAVDTDFLPTFHDRLLDDCGRMVGIRIWPVSPAAAEFLRSLPRAEYTSFGDGFVDVWLSEGPIQLATSSGDQAFGARIFRSASVGLALAIDINYLCASERDLASVEGANASWVSIS